MISLIHGWTYFVNEDFQFFINQFRISKGQELLKFITSLVKPNPGYTTQGLGQISRQLIWNSALSQPNVCSCPASLFCGLFQSYLLNVVIGNISNRVFSTRGYEIIIIITVLSPCTVVYPVLSPSPVYSLDYLL